MDIIGSDAPIASRDGAVKPYSHVSAITTVSLVSSSRFGYMSSSLRPLGAPSRLRPVSQLAHPSLRLCSPPFHHVRFSVPASPLLDSPHLLATDSPHPGWRLINSTTGERMGSEWMDLSPGPPSTTPSLSAIPKAAVTIRFEPKVQLCPCGRYYYKYPYYRNYRNRRNRSRTQGG